MKVDNMKTIALSIPFEKPYVGARGLLRKTINLVIVELASKEGLEAFGLAYVFMNDRFVRPLKAAVDDLRETIIGQDVFRWAEAWQKLWEDTMHLGHEGYGIYSLSAIDSALWNLRAKALGIPLARLLGGFREEVPVYANHMLFPGMSIDELQKNAAFLVKQGFRAIKMNIGDKPAKMEIERVRAVREAVGEDIDIMIDVCWAWTVSQAIKMGRELECYNIYWLEDPVFNILNDDINGLAQVASALTIPVAAGETLCSKNGFRPLLEKRAVDILIIDLMCVGGVTEWMRVATMAQAWNLPVASHIFHDFSPHLIAAIPNGVFVEYLPWWDVIYQEPHKIMDGHIRIPNKPGLGLELDPRAIKKYEMK